jgi:hypothetical protein
MGVWGIDFIRDIVCKWIIYVLVRLVYSYQYFSSLYRCIDNVVHGVCRSIWIILYGLSKLLLLLLLLLLLFSATEFSLGGSSTNKNKYT